MCCPVCSWQLSLEDFDIIVCVAAAAVGGLAPFGRWSLTSQVLNGFFEAAGRIRSSRIRADSMCASGEHAVSDAASVNAAISSATDAGYRSRVISEDQHNSALTVRFDDVELAVLVTRLHTSMTGERSEAAWQAIWEVATTPGALHATPLPSACFTDAMVTLQHCLQIVFCACYLFLSSLRSLQILDNSQQSCASVKALHKAETCSEHQLSFHVNNHHHYAVGCQEMLRRLYIQWVTSDDGLTTKPSPPTLRAFSCTLNMYLHRHAWEEAANIALVGASLHQSAAADGMKAAMAGARMSQTDGVATPNQPSPEESSMAALLQSIHSLVISNLSKPDAYGL